MAGSDEKRLVLALDASPVGDRLTMLWVSGLVGGGAIPVAWKLLSGKTSGAWTPHWQALFQAMAQAIPATWWGVVTADRRFYAAWLVEAIQAHGWHSLLRMNPIGVMCPEGETDWQALDMVVSCPGERWSGRWAYLKTTPLSWTLLTAWEERHDEPWLVVTDLPPDQAKVWWYGWRMKIARGFRETKRGLFQWHRARVIEPTRAERQWLILALAPLRLTAIGAQTEASSRHGPERSTRRRADGRPSRRLSLLRQGMVVLLAALVLALTWQQRSLCDSLWPTETTTPTPQRAVGVHPPPAEYG